MAKPALTPCVDICEIDPESRLCRGCGRTIEEIARWSSMSDGERRLVMEALKGRIKNQAGP